PVMLLSSSSSFFASVVAFHDLHSFPTRRSSDLHCCVPHAHRRFGKNSPGRCLPDGAYHQRGNLRLHEAPSSGKSGRNQTKRILKDRKSTRLNSSHVSISYAVFCLKKKTCTDEK